MCRKFAGKTCLDLAELRPDVLKVINEKCQLYESSEVDEREYSKREVRSLLSVSPISSLENDSNHFDLQVRFFLIFLGKIFILDCRC